MVDFQDYGSAEPDRSYDRKDRSREYNKAWAEMQNLYSDAYEALSTEEHFRKPAAPIVANVCKRFRQKIKEVRIAIIPDVEKDEICRHLALRIDKLEKAAKIQS